jgi:hypothetical protein
MPTLLNVAAANKPIMGPLIFDAHS